MILIAIIILLFIDIDISMHVPFDICIQYTSLITKICIPEYNIFYLGSNSRVLALRNKQLEEHKLKNNL